MAEGRHYLHKYMPTKPHTRAEQKHPAVQSHLGTLDTLDTKRRNWLLRAEVSALLAAPQGQEIAASTVSSCWSAT